MKMQRDKRAHRTFGDVFGHFSRADVSGWISFRESPLLGWIMFVVLCTTITFLMTFSISDIPEEIAVGSIAQHDVRADRTYEIVDRTATDKFREEALDTVLSVYDFDNDIGKRIVKQVSSTFEDMRKAMTEGASASQMRSDFEKLLGVSMEDGKWNSVLDQNFNKQLELAVTGQVSSVMNRLIVKDIDSLQSEKSRGIALRDTGGKERTLSAKETAGIISLDEAVKRVAEGKLLGPKNPPVSAYLASLLIQPNVAYNLQETEKNKKSAIDNVKSVAMKVEAGETIIRAGARYEPRHLIILEGIRLEKNKTFTPFKISGIFLIVALVILSTYYFAERFIKKFAPNRTDIYFLGFVLIFTLLLLRLSVGLSRAIHDTIGMDIPMAAFYYAIPVGGAAMLVRFILNSETALVFSIVAGIFAGVYVGNDLNYTAYCLISGIAAATSIAYADKRSEILKAGFYTALINVLAAVSVQLINANSITESLTAFNLFWYISFALLGGFSCAILVTLITPVAESVFGYTTDIKLLELANLNHPLLRELVIRAPGTYHHSHLVGILAETASESIGANPLLTRVAAYYHDIGKIRKPLYFVENTTDCESRHEKLTPNMSALIIASHVKDGLELAAQYKVPKRIMDMIPQHHGTKMISFFYEKAKKMTDPSMGKIDEKDFRYQGPKPQTREAGILLLADAVEAAVRSLKEKTPTRIQQMVEDVINSSFTEAQLDECDLTLRNMHDIAKAFTKILMGIYHQRIEYPKEALQGNGNNNVIK